MPCYRLLLATALIGCPAVSAQESEPLGSIAQRVEGDMRAAGPNNIPLKVSPQVANPTSPPSGEHRLQQPGYLNPAIDAKPLPLPLRDGNLQPARFVRAVEGTDSPGRQPPRPRELASAASMKPTQEPEPRRDPRKLRRSPQRVATKNPTEKKPLLGGGWSNLPASPVTSGAAIALVVGLLLLTLSVCKKAAPRSQRMLPSEVAAVLGRIPLGGKQVAHLIKVGSKLVLVCVTPEGVKPLTEVTDPEEVTRLLGLCEQQGDHSATTAFRDVFDKLASEPAAPGFLGDESPLIDRQQLAAAYANTPGGRSRE